jgi:hypothetical protein
MPQMREVSGASAVTRKSHVSHLATLIDLPWQRVKMNTARQARRPRRRNGPVLVLMLGTGWDAVSIDDFVTLVDDAVDGDRDAKNTPTIAGGVSLMTDSSSWPTSTAP